MLQQFAQTGFELPTFRHFPVRRQVIHQLRQQGCQSGRGVAVADAGLLRNLRHCVVTEYLADVVGRDRHVLAGAHPRCDVIAQTGLLEAIQQRTQTTKRTTRARRPALPATQHTAEHAAETAAALAAAQHATQDIAQTTTAARLLAAHHGKYDRQQCGQQAGVQAATLRRLILILPKATTKNTAKHAIEKSHVLNLRCHIDDRRIIQSDIATRTNQRSDGNTGVISKQSSGRQLASRKRRSECSRRKESFSPCTPRPARES